MFEFRPFPKIPRYYRETIITEKIDGTNAQIVISAAIPEPSEVPGTDVTQWHLQAEFALGFKDGFAIYAGSRNRYITPENDNYGFASWVKANQDQLFQLGRGQHFGEWWGRGIGRNYGLDHRRFSLFNVSRWKDGNHPACCHVVPVLGQGSEESLVSHCLDLLRDGGSWAASGFMNPEGIIIYHSAANSCFKVTLENDSQPKGKNDGKA